MLQMQYKVSPIPPLGDDIAQTLEAFLNKVGKDGWDLVSCLECGRDVFVFKREVQDCVINILYLQRCNQDKVMF